MSAASARIPEKSVRELESKIIQIQSIPIPAGPNNGDHVELVALCEDGSVWVQYRSNGFANVPNDGWWYQVHSDHHRKSPPPKITHAQLLENDL